ncbi:3-oxoacyl-[acyl-carrier-protein] synthase III C-terminal domain-containing protein, partial [Lactiplantibacillus plantarum]|uniref:3-oxoacyl-[acyl-carrier-protein] synthase III C-terminal domain-containing protein n=1 Tax=Lactiplantibacillus plantarum TaxID=1590 RepID=UPI0029C9B795
RSVKSVGQKLKLATEQLPMNIAQYGNTAAASEPILFAEIVAQKKVQRGDKLVFTCFGGGLSVGSALIEY